MWKKSKRKPNTEVALSLYVPEYGNNPAVVFPGEVVEQMRGMVTRIGREGTFPRRLSIVSSLRGEGVTYISHALAATIANDLSISVCIVDLNWWYPSSALFEGSHEPGLAAVLTGEAQLEEAIIPMGWSNLSYLPAGMIAKQDRAMISRSKILKDTIEELSQIYDTLILDIPAILATNDAIPLASLGEACCMVIQQNVTSLEDVRQALDEVAHLKVLGTVMNRNKLATPKKLVKFLASI